MRYLLLILGLLSAQLSFAQSNQVDRRQSAAAAAAAYNIKQQVDCFSSKFDAGNVSVRQGEFQAAINHFEEAKACPDAQNNDRRLQELESLIKYCLERIGSHKSAEKTSEDIAAEPTNSAVVNNAPGRGKFSISKALRYNTDPNCFAITMNEANRAFRGGYWDDAAKLYRAAKTCADASQPDRESMNNRIEACQNAAIQELERSKEAALFSEQKAISERRVTLATKLANDAMELIRQGNRSLAFRLADFANFYIAPEDNADCMKAMISAKFYSPAFSDNNVIQPPFAYHLAEDPSATAILRFGWLEKELLLYAYFPAGRRMTAWSIPEMTQVFDFVAPTLQDPVSFDISPDGGFLYIGTNFFALPDNQLIELESPGLYCFSQDGKYFYYEDNRAGVIRSVKINSGYSDMQQVKKGTRSKSVAVQEITIPIESKLFSLAADQDFIWLGYEDRVVASRKSSKAAKLGNNLVWKFDASVYGMVINPERRELLINADSVVYYGFLNWSPTSSDTTWISVKKVFNGPLKGYTVGKDTLLGFSIVSKTDVFEGDYSIFAPESNQVMHRFNGSHSLVVGSVAFSSNGHWLATTENGAILLWPIHDSQTKPPVTYETNFDDHLSYDGAYLVSNKQSQLQVYQADQAGKGPIASFDKHPDSALPRGESRYWAVFWVDTNQLMLRNLETNVALKLKTKQFSTDDVTNFTFDPTENKYFAAANSEGLVTVWSLATGNEIASRQFGGFNTQVLYQPGTDRLIVISQKNYSEFAARSSFYFWNFLDPDSKPEPIPLYDYQASLATVSEQGDMIALSDRYTIHVFSLLDGYTELAVINPSATINQIRFRPDGGALAGGCDNGTVITWEPSGGAPKIKFIYNSGGENFLISHMAYTSNGQSLRIGYFGQLATIELNSFDLRESMQSGSRWLNSFTPAQIREYQLETAWQFTGFFERLEDEGDYPLIRSFFHYFKEQSFINNNLPKVKTYCSRALKLYDLLGKVQSAENLKPELLAMYENLILKCLYRNDIESATDALKIMHQRFNHPVIATLNEAHIALFRREYSNAVRLYADYLFKSYNDPQVHYKLDEIKADILAFQDAEMIDSTQVSCFCTVFQPFPNFEWICPLYQSQSVNSYAEEAFIYYQLNTLITDATYASDILDKKDKLELAFNASRKVRYPNPVVTTHPYELSAIALTDLYGNIAVLEENSPKELEYYNKGISLLEQFGPFKNSPDTARLDRLARLYLSKGRYYMRDNRPTEAVAQLQLCISSLEKLLKNYDAAISPLFKNNAQKFLGAAKYDLGMALLYEGKAKESKMVFEEVIPPGNMNSFNLVYGHAALLEKDSVSALIEYGSIKSAQELGVSLAHIRFMADAQPHNRERLLQYIPHLKSLILKVRPAVLAREVDYWQNTSLVKAYQTRQKPDSALVYATHAFRAAQYMMASFPDAQEWRRNYIYTCIDYTYFTVLSKHSDTEALSEMIRVAENVLYLATGTSSEEQYLALFVTSNLAHALWLRGNNGDRDRAVKLYQQFLQQNGWYIIQKDLDDFRQAGISWPDYEKLIDLIKPGM